MFLLYITILLIPVYAAHSSQQCPCKYVLRPDQNKYCQSDFVIQALIKGRSCKGEWIKYSVRVQHTFTAIVRKGRNRRNKKVKRQRLSNKFVLFSKKSRDACGVNTLIVGQVYILSGNVVGKMLHLDLCTSIVIDRTKITETQLENINVNYDKSCDKCQVDLCQVEADCKKTRNTCVSTFFNFTCFNMFSVCARTGVSRAIAWIFLIECGRKPKYSKLQTHINKLDQEPSHISLLILQNFVSADMRVFLFHKKVQMGRPHNVAKAFEPETIRRSECDWKPIDQSSPQFDSACMPRFIGP